MQLHEQDDTGVDVGSNETGSARTSADPGRPGRGRLRPLAAGLAAFAALLALPLQAEAQKTTFVSNTGQSTATSLRGIGPTGIGSFFYSQAQRFSTGSNEGGYTLSAIQVQADNFESASSPRVSIYTVTSDNPGTLLYVLTNPATLNDNAINTFRAPANATLEKDTDYFVVFEATGSGSNTRYDLKGTVSANEDSGTASGWSIADTSRERATNSGNWSSVFARLKIAVRGTIPPAISIADASAAENAGHLLFEVTLSRSFQNTVKVDFETISGGTATEGEDYHARRTYTHVILEGDKTAQMGFALIEDTVAAAGETVKVRLSNARVVDAYGDKIKDLDITRAEATGTITAPTTTTTNVPGLTIRIKDATGDEDDGYLDFRVRLSRKHDDYVCYDFETISGGTAMEGMDYLKFPKATYWMQIGKRVDKPFVRIIDDSVNDNGETVKVKISNARLCNDASQTLSITRAEATGTIRNTDPLPQAFKFSLFPSLVSAQERVQETRLLVQATPSNRAEATPGVGALDFAHFANGEGIISDLVLMNVATHPIRPVLYFYDKEGHPIAAESMVDLTEDLEVTEDGGLSIQTEMEPLGELTVSTHGRGELVSGSVAVAANGPIGGVLRFDLPDIGVAGVGASPPVRDALFPARRQAGGIRTAAALHNLGEEAITVSCRLMSGGRVLEAVEIDLEANGQEARYIEELFTATDTSDFVGSVRCTAPGLFTGIAVELDEGNRIFTTLPVVPVARAGGGGQETVLYFAHFANGSGTTSDLVFVNVSPRPSGPGPTPYHAAVSPSRPALYFYDQEGNLMDPASVVDLTGDLEVTGDGALSIQTEMEPLGELTISTHGRGELVSGSVKVVSEGPIGGVLRYALPGIGVTGVGASQPVRDALFPVRQEGGLATAAAIHNLTESDLVVTCRLMKDGAVLEETQIPLAANGQEARYIEEMFTFTGADVSDFVGSVRCTVPPGEAMFTGVAVEIDEGNRIFTTLPVVPVERAADSQE